MYLFGGIPPETPCVVTARKFASDLNTRGFLMSARRFTIRVLIIVVAVAAVGVWGVKMWNRSKVFAQTAENHRLLMSFHMSNAEIYENNRRRTMRFHPSAFWSDEEKMWLDSIDAHIAAFRRDAEYEERLYRKYHRAARFPWLSVAADPPPPEPLESDLPWPWQ